MPALPSLPPRPTRAEADAYIRAALPKRARDSHKGSFGRAVLACGSLLYAGAALLAAEGALRMGAGLTFLAAPHEVAFAARTRLPEVITRELPPITEAPAAYLPYFAEAGERGAILIGCGIGGAADPNGFADMLRALLSETGAPVVLDADALNLLSRVGAADILRGARRPVLLTPHPLEFARLTGQEVADIQADRIGAACRFAADTGATVLLKGADSVIADGNGYAVCPSGSPALSKGGTGDVLAGMLTALLAEGLPPFAATFAAAYLHGAAGEALARSYSEYGVLPSELPAAAAEILREITENNEFWRYDDVHD
ncbi:MAG: NAD(P)H-hydrate dehydratase [Clostridia bacterium]|nr:NAD(P)H-hydrate dehydratase [Clostridia bacterium]